MKTLLVVIVVMALMAVTPGVAFADTSESFGPAPNLGDEGDAISDGSRTGGDDDGSGDEPPPQSSGLLGDLFTQLGNRVTGMPDEPGSGVVAQLVRPDELPVPIDPKAADTTVAHLIGIGYGSGMSGQTGLDLDYYDLFGILEIPDWVESLGAVPAATYDDEHTLKAGAKVDIGSGSIAIKIKRS